MERDYWREQGWYAIRTHDDDSVCDVIAARCVMFGYPESETVRDGDVWTDPEPSCMVSNYEAVAAQLFFIEVKANRTGGAFHNFRPAARRRLLDAAALAGAEAYLTYWPPHGGGYASRQFIPAADWPDNRKDAP